MQHISQADGHYSNFSTELLDVAQGLSQHVSTDDLNSLCDRTVKATNSALERGAEMRQKFSDLAVEMQQVRSALARSREEARSDALTGVYNRLAFQEEIGRLAEYVADDSHTPCLLLVDIDFFKRINDSYGHLAGDRVAKTVAHKIRQSVRGRDIVARYGGEEFAILLRVTSRSGCMAIAENVRLHVAQTVIELPADLGYDQPVEVTVSLFERSDRALYRSKENGRNQLTWKN